jgi:glycosyltransferase involved in cell wall biosynthesis
MKIHVWVPDYVSSMGGVQTLSRFLVRALRECLPDADLTVFSKNDRSVPDSAENSATRFSTVGWWALPQRTAAFTVELFRCAMRERPDLIITTHVNFAPVAHWLQKLFGIPFIALGNGIEVWEIPSAHLRRALRSADKLLAISEFTRQRMAEALGIPTSQIDLFSCTFDPEKFVPAPKPHYLLKRYGLRPDQPVILTIARLASYERRKGYDQILDSLSAVRRRFPGVRYILGGGGSDKERVVALIKKLHIHDNVILPGYIADHELCGHYNLCDVFAMPSTQEGFGIVFLEALACGKPVIAGNKDGAVDALRNGELGVLVDPDDMTLISNVLCFILGNRHSHRLLYNPEELRRRAIQGFGPKQFAEKLKMYLEKVLANR